MRSIRIAGAHNFQNPLQSLVGGANAVAVENLAANALGGVGSRLDYCRRALDHGVALNDLPSRASAGGAWVPAHIPARVIWNAELQCCDEALALGTDPL